MGKKVLGFDLDKLPQNCIGNQFDSVCRKAAAEGIVMLKNNNNVLPLGANSKVSVFGRMQNHYIMSGTGSGGLVNVKYSVGIIEGLKNAGISINKELYNIYADWETTHPFDNGNGWASEPWSQAEMELSDTTVKKAAEFSDTAIVIIGRTAGEDKDNKVVEGSYLLTELEEKMMSKVTLYFNKVIILLNVSNIIDMKWITKYDRAAILYVWLGGQEGGNAVADIITGKITPSGKLSDTIALDIADYPSTKNFDKNDKLFYCEDIYVGYRYFNTFAPEKILFPFGYGLSYTHFKYSEFEFEKDNGSINLSLLVQNTGRFSGKETIQIYCSMPQGKLGKPEKVLVAFKKTKTLASGDKTKINLTFCIDDVASFDDIGITGNKSCFVLENGSYKILVSTDALNDIFSFSFALDNDIVVKKCKKAMAPIESFNRIKPCINENGAFLSDEKLTAETLDNKRNFKFNIPEEIQYSGDKNIKLIDVKNGKESMEKFIAQLSDEDLSCIAVGEGMNSHKVTGGTGCAFGGVTDTLLNLGVPIACGTDGPSGIRMDCGANATLMPSGTLLACTWNVDLVEELYTYEGIEMAAYNIDVLLGPGINIHRNPLCGRNFEYFSEDPVLTWKIASAICKGLSKSNVSATIKHFCANNQERNRHDVNSVVSERALREIYLKAFEMIIKEGYCKAVMTSYNAINGCWAAGNYDLTTVILRDEWKFDGFVMTDWWAKTEKDFVVWERNSDTPPRNFAPMVNAQNDIYMVHNNASDFEFNTLLNDLKKGKIKRNILQRNAMNICRYLMNSNAMEKIGQQEIATMNSIKNEYEYNKIFETCDLFENKCCNFNAENDKKYILSVDIVSKGTHLSQNTIIFYVNDNYLQSFTVNGTYGKKVTLASGVVFPAGVCNINAKFPENVLEVTNISIFEKSK